MSESGMTIGRFLEVTRACDALLLDPRAHRSWLASPFLHPISAHPVVIHGSYRDLTDGGKGSDPSHPTLGALRHLRNLGSSLATGDGAREGRRDVILVGGLVDPKHLGDE